MRSILRTTAAPFAAALAVAALIVAAWVGLSTRAGYAAADTELSPIVEDYSYPGAAQILATQHVRLIRGDGHIVLVDCATPVSGEIGLFKVYTSEEAAGGTGQGRICFRILAAAGFLDLEVPGVYEMHGDGLQTGKGHVVNADLRTDEGENINVDVDPDGSTQVGQGVNVNDPATMLLRLAVTG
jgi:hypothetical protein